MGSAAALQHASPPAQAPDQQSALEERIRDAVQAAVHYPAAARMMGVTGRARVRLDYRSGVVDDPSLAQSSGAPMLDHAAISAARTAHYPPPPPELAGRLLRFLVWVEFRSA
ncbi:energy transducer TonB [Rhodopila sp.]|uniref:energy transducer TonB n=1 Tax=Rhodopila sp. TaxID=2480087 RepID=UPI003D0F09B1